MRKEDSGEGRRSEGSQEPRVPGGDHARRGPRAGVRRARGGGPEGRRRGVLDPRRGVRRGRGQDPRPGGRRLGRRRDGAQGQGAGRRGVPPDAGGAAALHLPPPGSRPAADRGADQAQGHRHRLRDRAAALGRAAAALPDVRGGRLSRAPGGRALADEGRGRSRGADGRRRRGRQRQGGDHRCRRLRPERRQHRARHGRRRDPARHRPRQAADVVLALQQPGARPGFLEADHRAAGDRGRPGHRCRARFPGPRRPRWSATSWCPG